MYMFLCEEREMREKGRVKMMDGLVLRATRSKVQGRLLSLSAATIKVLSVTVTVVGLKVNSFNGFNGYFNSLNRKGKEILKRE